MQNIPKCYATNVREWRDWFKKNHEKESEVILIKNKRHTKKPAMSHRESMAEAICWGWIDTTVKRIDENRFANKFVKRKKTANWSRNTLGVAKQMIKEKRMTKFGLAAYKLGLKKKPLDHEVDRQIAPQKELLKELNKNKKAKDFFNNLPPSNKKVYILWIERAVLAETKKKRIKQVVKNCKEGIKLKFKID